MYEKYKAWKKELEYALFRLKTARKTDTPTNCPMTTTGSC